MRVSRAAETGNEKVGSMREGVLDQKHLLFGEDGSPNNYDLNMGLTGSGGWRTPRHRHTFDQIRYVIKGTLPYSETDVLEEGWVGYFPESVHYGPQERFEGLRTLVLQCGGASGGGYLRVAQRGAVNAGLAKTGKFEKGLYHYTDENGEPAPLHRDPVPDQRPGLGRWGQVRSRDRIRVPRQRGSRACRGGRADRVLALRAAHVLSRHGATRGRMRPRVAPSPAACLRDRIHPTSGVHDPELLQQRNFIDGARVIRP